MGYCRNARCKEIFGLALVRRQELACRLGWNDDYYEPLVAEGGVLPGEQRPALDAIRQRSGFQGTKPDDILVGIDQPRPVMEQEPMQAPRTRASNVGEAHRRALERRQLAQQSGDDTYAPRRLGQPALPGGDTAGTPGSPPNARMEEGVSAPRRVETATPAGGYESPDAHTASIAIPPDLADGHAGMYTSTSAPAPAPQQAPPAAPPPQWAEPQPQPQPLPPTAQPPPPRSPLVAEWEAQARQHHRGKRCANCRDFQIAESGDRGWCRNRFAFPTPQVVGPNDLACLSAIGTWWAANDQWWLAKAAPPAREPVPTPLTDTMIEELREAERRRAGLRRPNTG